MNYKGPVVGRMLSFSIDEPDTVCCSRMFFHITEKEKIIRYEKRIRVFGIVVSETVIQEISYCPWCGNRLPDPLYEKLSQILFDELNLDSLEDDPNMPNEFKTDEWWKKRGL